MNFDIIQTTNINQIDPALWDKLVAGRPFTSQRWCRFGEAVLNNGRRSYNVLVRHGEPVAGAMYWLDFYDYLPVRGLVRRILEAIIRRRPLMTGCSPLAPTSGLFLPENPTLQQLALNALLELAEVDAKRYRASFIIFNYLSSTTGVAWPAGYATLSFFHPGTVLEIEWADFDGYLSQLRKSVRKDFRRHCNRARDIGIEVHVHDKVVSDVDQALALIRNVESHHNASSRSWLRAALKHTGMVDTIWLAAEIEGELVGCGLLLGDNGVYNLALLGLDYDIEYVYFQLVYAAIRAAIERGARMLRGGTEAYELKKRLLFREESDHHLIFSTQLRLVKIAVPWLTRSAMNG